MTKCRLCYKFAVYDVYIVIYIRVYDDIFVIFKCILSNICYISRCSESEILSCLADCAESIT